MSQAFEQFVSQDDQSRNEWVNVTGLYSDTTHICDVDRMSVYYTFTTRGSYFISRNVTPDKRSGIHIDYIPHIELPEEKRRTLVYDFIRYHMRRYPFVDTDFVTEEDFFKCVDPILIDSFFRLR